MGLGWDIRSKGHPSFSEFDGVVTGYYTYEPPKANRRTQDSSFQSGLLYGATVVLQDPT